MNDVNRMRLAALGVFIISCIVGIIDARANAGKLEFGGYIKLNAMLDTNGGPDILTIDHNKGTRIGLSGRETRLDMTYTNDETPIGSVRAYVQTDFSGRGGSIASTKTGLLLRHAYVETDHFLIGQTFTTFADLGGYLELLDYDAHGGTVYTRQPMIRVQGKYDDFTVRVAVENSTTNLGNGLITDDQRLPDFVGRLDYDQNWGHFSASGILRELRIDDGDINASKMIGGFGLVFASDLIPDKLKISAQYIRGGLGHYGSYFSYFSDGALMVNESGQRFIDPLVYQSAVLGATYNWSERLRSTVMGSWAKSLEPGENTQLRGEGIALDEAKWFHANIFYEVIKGYDIAFEYRKTKARLINGENRNTDRFQFSMIYRL